LQSRNTRGGFKNKARFKALLGKLKFLKSKKFLFHLIKLKKFYNLVYKVDIEDKLIILYISKMEKLLFHHGYNRTSKLLHQLYNYALRHSVRHTSDRVPKFKAQPDGFPVFLKPFKKYLEHKDLNVRSSVLTILELHKSLGVCSTIPDPTGIVKSGNFAFKNPLKDTVLVGDYFRQLASQHDLKYNHVAKIWEDLLEEEFPESNVIDRVDQLRSKSTIHKSYKSGPNGPCLRSSIMDFISIHNRGDKTESLADNVYSLALHSDNVELKALFDHFVKKFNDLSEDSIYINLGNSPPKHSKFSIKFETSGKSRLIAILDFFTQSVLKGMHSDHFDWLFNQIEDGTNDQYRVKTICKHWTSKPFNKEDGLYSIDLTEATNRAPAALQYEIIRKMYGPEIAHDWYSLCTNRSFLDPTTNSFVRYSVGQPMGTYTSWSSFTIMNHLMVRLSCKLNNIDYKRNLLYLIIGDDVVTRGETLSEQYSLLMRDIGVDISPTKGYTCKTSFDFINEDSIIGNHVAEIAKSVFCNGKEVTPIRFGTYEKLFGSPTDHIGSLYELEARGIDLEYSILENMFYLSQKPSFSCKMAMSIMSNLSYTRDLYNLISDDEPVKAITGYLSLQSEQTIEKTLSCLDYSKQDYEKTIKNNMINDLKKNLVKSYFSLQKLLNLDYGSLPSDYQNGIQNLCNNIHNLKDFALMENSKYFLEPIFDLIFLDYLEDVYQTIYNITFGKSLSQSVEKTIEVTRSTYNLLNILIGNFGSKNVFIESRIINELYSNLLKFESIEAFNKKGETIINIPQPDPTLNMSWIEKISYRLENSNLKESDKSLYLNSDTGFKSILSPEVSSVMDNLGKKFGFSLGTKDPIKETTFPRSRYSDQSKTMEVLHGIQRRLEDLCVHEEYNQILKVKIDYISKIIKDCENSN